MRKRLFLVFALMVMGGIVLAASLTLTFTTAQDNSIQGKLIPMYNKQHCARFLLPASCTTAQLQGTGCSPVVIKTVTTDACTIFTQDAAGEAAFVQELANQKLYEVFVQLDSSNNTDFCVGWKSMTTVQQNAICSAMVPALPAGCQPCS